MFQIMKQWRGPELPLRHHPILRATGIQKLGLRLEAWGLKFCSAIQASSLKPQAFSSSLQLAFILSGVVASLFLSALVFGGEETSPKSGNPETNPDWAEGQTVQEIEIHGLSRVDEATVLRLIRIRKGRPFDRKSWDEDWHRLDESGYFLDVRTTEPQPYPGGVLLAIDFKEKGSISKITFSGNKAVSSVKLLDVIKSNEGGRYDPGQIHEDMKLIEKYYKERAFRGVKVSTKKETVSSHQQLVGGKEIEVDDEVRVIFTIEEESPVGVRVIRFKGKKSFSDTVLKEVMATKQRRLFRAGDLKDDELEIDVKRLQAFYLRHGYVDVSVEKPVIILSNQTYWNWFRKRKRLAEVVITINEGPQYFTGNVTLGGNTTIDRDEIEAVMKIKPGSVFSELLLYDDEERIASLYGERGRVFTKVEHEQPKLVNDPERTRKTPNIYDVNIRIRESAEVTLREVITRGNTKTRDKVIVRQMELFPGDRIDTTKMKIAIQRLKNLDYFNDDIHITPEPTENPEEANLIIDVAEKSTGKFSFGVGVSSVDSVVGNFNLTQKNFDFRDMPKSWRDFLGGNAFVGAGETFSLDVSGGPKRQNYTVSFFEPWAFDRPVRLGGSLFRTVDSRFRNFEQTNTGMTTSVGKRLWGPRWDGEVTYRLSFTGIQEDNAKNLPPILRDQAGDVVLSSVTPRLVYDSRDSRLQPSRGFLMEAALEIGGGPFLGSLNWVKPQLDLARYLTVYKLPSGGKHILELHARAAAIESFGDTRDVPPFMRFYAGGIDTVRGFQYRTITPLENHFPIGGKRMVVGSAEYSLPLYEEVVRASLFVDAGSVSDAGETDPRTRVSNESGLRASTGIGMSIRTPLSPLPIRFYLSRPLIKNDEDRTKTFDFSFGTRF